MRVIVLRSCLAPRHKLREGDILDDSEFEMDELLVLHEAGVLDVVDDAPSADDAQER